MDGTGRTIAVLDRGLAPSHPSFGCLTDQTWTHATPCGRVIAYIDYTAPNRKPWPLPIDPGHGTTVAAVAAGGRYRGATLGVAPRARIIFARIRSNSGPTAAAIRAATRGLTDPDDNPATRDQPDVIFGAWAATDPATKAALAVAARTWREAGITVVFAAGNLGPGLGTIPQPALLPDVLTIGAANTTQPARYSSRGCPGALTPTPACPTTLTWPGDTGRPPGLLQKPDLTAPGTNILTACPTQSTTCPRPGLTTQSGTSYSAAITAGVVALLRQTEPTATPGAIAAALRASATDIPPRGIDPATGWGLIHPQRALATLRNPEPTRLRLTSAAGRRATLRTDALLERVTLSGPTAAGTRLIYNRPLGRVQLTCPATCNLVLTGVSEDGGATRILIDLR